MKMTRFENNYSSAKKFMISFAEETFALISFFREFDPRRKGIPHDIGLFHTSLNGKIIAHRVNSHTFNKEHWLDQIGTFSKGFVICFFPVKEDPSMIIGFMLPAFLHALLNSKQ